MPPYTVSADLKAWIPVLHACGYGIQKICHILGIKKTLVYKTLSLHHSFGTIENPSHRYQARNRLLSSTDLQFVLDLLQSKPTIYLDEIQNELLRHLGCQISIPSLFRTLQHLNFTIFMNHIAEIAPDANMLLFGDEAARDICTLFWKDGRALKGVQCVQKKHFL
ncbi:hypothetical protein SCLCIDRAFT_15175 [Scleroderma citrinum Foug A]|uniref:Uncharacterized protein n=1 Tax=Scleroderma citrinum Foug A TaxID=1036808 RepID=A0A0C3E862_9AGAM|nr:hypothetical protein SCLCIDRAFT_15175 [Scleroderma citrinum Foug A]